MDPSAVPYHDPSGYASDDVSPLADLISAACQAGRSGQLTFVSEDNTILIFLQHGQIIHASYRNAEGPDTVYFALTWPPGTSSFDESVLPHKRTIQQSWDQLIFEGAMLADQGAVQDPTLNGGGGNASIAVARTVVQGGQPRLTILEGGPLEAQTFDIDQDCLNVGRIYDVNQICLPENAVSSRHCMIIRRGEDIILRDLNSANGTFVNGRQISETILQLGDVVQIGGVQLKFEAGFKRPKPRAAPPSPAKAAAVANINTVKMHTTPMPQRRPVSTSAPIKASQDLSKSYVDGKAPIMFEDLAKPTEQKKSGLATAFVVVVTLLLIAAAIFYFVVLKR